MRKKRKEKWRGGDSRREMRLTEEDRKKYGGLMSGLYYQRVYNLGLEFVLFTIMPTSDVDF